MHDGENGPLFGNDSTSNMGRYNDSHAFISAASILFVKHCGSLDHWSLKKTHVGPVHRIFQFTIGHERHGRLLVVITILKNSAILDPSNVSHSPSILVASWLATSAPTSNYRLHSVEKEA